MHEQHVGLSREAEDELALGAVADDAGVSLESLRANVKRLERLCPPLVTRRARGEVKPALLVRLALDLDAVTSSMMRLKILLPNADVAEMCARKLALFESDAVDRAVAVAAKVRRDFPERFGDEKNKTSTGRTTADALLASVPDILLVDSDEALGRIVLRARALRSLLPGADIAALAGKQPSFLLTDDAGRSLARGGHAAGLEVGRSYEPGVPKRPIEAVNAHASDARAGTTDPIDDSSWLDSWQVFVSIREMKKRMPPECDVDRLLTDFPNLLAMDVPALFEDVARVFPNRDPADVLRRNPKIAYQVRFFTGHPIIIERFFLFSFGLHA